MLAARLRVLGTFFLLGAFGCGDSTAPAERALRAVIPFRLVGLMVGADGTTGALEVTVGPGFVDTPAVVGSGRVPARGALQMSSGETARLAGSWNDNECPSGYACVPERYPTLVLRGDGWTLGPCCPEYGVGAFTRAGARGYFVYRPSSDSAPAAALCGRWTGTVMVQDSTWPLDLPWLMLIWKYADAIISQGDTAPFVFPLGSVAGGAIHTAYGDTTGGLALAVDISGTVASDRRSANGTISYSATWADSTETMESEWRATAAGCVTPPTVRSAAAARWPRHSP